MNRLAKIPAGGGGGSGQVTGYPRTLLENKLNERYFELETKLKTDVQGGVTVTRLLISHMSFHAPSYNSFHTP